MELDLLFYSQFTCTTTGGACELDENNPKYI